jgi:hypothetical protein
MKKMPPPRKPRLPEVRKIVRGKDVEEARQSAGYKMQPTEDGRYSVGDKLSPTENRSRKYANQ